ncbi:hypothetical protein [uncultured Muriicola sp.]|uniref:hypothetical protein n=1 Tax=uncultured Muriicola sp. TaxID=1583102 RepID=UPI00262E350F|nr:hypothetical protein [uncultured Muriicola sp.]
MTTYKNFLIPVFIILILSGCRQGPKTAEPYTITRAIDKNAKSSEVNYEMREVVIKELQPTPKYIYARVQEGEQFYWIATQKQDLEIGKPYLYNESLLKTQFESKEFDRIFDTLFLVTTLVPKDHGIIEGTFHGSQKSNEKIAVIKEVIAKQDSAAIFMGAVRIADLVNNPGKYEGNEVVISGECVKVNANILDRNWLHLKDGSKDDFDLIVTSDEQVQKGNKITIRGIVRLNADFGSGYSYPILIENGRLVD